MAIEGVFDPNPSLDLGDRYREVELINEQMSWAYDTWQHVQAAVKNVEE